jgi:protoporphyrinogen oxidase
LPPELCVSFHEWRRANNLSVLHYKFLTPITMYGYGYLLDDASGDIPLVYVMKYLIHEHLEERFQSNAIAAAPVKIAGGVGSPTGAQPLTRLYRLGKGGFGGLMQSLAGALKHTKILTAATIHQISRRKPEVTIGFTKGGGSAESVFDDVVIALPQTLANLEGLGLDLTDEERRLFAKVKTRQYFTCAVKVNQFPSASGSYSMVMDYGTSPPSINFRPGAGEPCHFLIPTTKQNPDGDAIAVVYSYSDRPVAQDVIRANIVKGINSLGGRPISEASILDVNAWQYFPHVDAEALAAHFYDDLDALQGVNGTYWAGGLLSFEITERVAVYSMVLADKYFG